jgi:uncharacterized membrane protein
LTLRAEAPDGDRLTRPLAVTLTVAAAVWAVTLLVVPLQASSRRSPFLVAAAHAAGALVCHQRPDRSFHVAGARLPVCARCTGLYLSGAAGALAGWFGLSHLPRRRRTVFALVALPTAVSVLGEWAGALTSSNGLRAAAALPLGAYAGWLFVRMLRAESARTTCAMID